MFPGDLIIDGYNLLHAASLAPSTDVAGGLERARLALVRLISGKLTPRERLRTTVVFDARGRTMGPSPPREVAGLLVMFADLDGDADVTIERLIRQNSAPRRLCVVSSDHRLQKAARRRRAKFLDSDLFLSRLARRLSSAERRDDDDEPAAKRSGRLPPSEVKAWLRVFEEVESLRCPEHGSFRERPSGASAGSRPKSSNDATDEKREGAAAEESLKNPSPPEDRPSDTLDEITFWESRISELDEEDSAPQD